MAEEVEVELVEQVQLVVCSVVMGNRFLMDIQLEKIVTILHRVPLFRNLKTVFEFGCMYCFKHVPFFVNCISTCFEIFTQLALTG